MANWQCSGLNAGFDGPDPDLADRRLFHYGGTPSDQSVVRCIQDLKARGLRVVFYPFLLMDCAGKPWRGRIGVSSDVSSAATAAVNAFLGSASTGAIHARRDQSDGGLFRARRPIAAIAG